MNSVVRIIYVLIIALCTAGVTKADLTQSQVLHFKQERRIQLDRTKLADDFCNARCDQHFNYCEYRGGSPEHCNRLLVRCRANC
jgi:hypothetical protein